MSTPSAGIDAVPGWLVVVVTAFGAVGGLAGVVGLYQATSTKRKIDSETAGNIVRAAGDLIAVQQETDRRHREECEKQLKSLALRVEQRDESLGKLADRVQFLEEDKNGSPRAQ